MINSYRPSSLNEALAILSEKDCHIFAGGTDLMIRKRQWQGAARRFEKDVLFINQLNEIAGVVETDESYLIKTNTTQSDVVDSAVLPEYIKYPYSLMSSPSIRNSATVGGNIVNAASVADSLPVLFALDAKVILESKDEARELSIREFIKDKYKTEIKQNEILTKVIIPKNDFDGYFYQKLGQRKASILSKLSVYVLYKIKDKKLVDFRFCIGAVNDTPVRLKNLEQDFIKTLDVDELISEVSKVLISSDDKRSTKEYREKTSLNLLRDYANKITERIK